MPYAAKSINVESLNLKVMSKLLPIGSVLYDKERQVARRGQRVQWFPIGTAVLQDCVVVQVDHDDRGYRYELIGLKSWERLTSRYILDESQACHGFFADLTYPSFVPEDLLEQIEAHAQAAEEERRRKEEIDRQFLHRGVLIVDYSERSIAIFTDDPKDAEILERIRAKRNLNLTYKGQKVAGWIFPKCRQAELAEVVRL